MDNAIIHRSKYFNKMKDEEKINVIYNAPYKSEFNPIELLFSQLRIEIKKNKNESKEDIEKILVDFKENYNKNKKEYLSKIFNNCFKKIEEFIK